MSYLDYPRLHFSGEFLASPSTINNDPAAYGNPNPAPEWNPNGTHFFAFRNCRIRKVLDKDGLPKLAAAQDDLIAGKVETTNLPAMAKLVDLDPDYQTGSQIWGAEIKVTQGGSAAGFTAKMDTATLRDIWFKRVPSQNPMFPEGIGGVYQTVLAGVKFDLAGASPALRQLNTLSPNRLSIKFVVHAYKEQGNTGKVVGTIGPVLANEAEQFLATRRMDMGVPLFSAQGPSSVMGAFGAVPFKVDPAHGKIIVDLGNAIPEKSPAGEREDMGNLTAVLLSTPPKELGSLPFDKADYEISAGIQDIPFNGAALAAAMNVHRFAIKRSKPGIQMVLSERTILVDANRVVVRLNPGDKQDIELTVMQLGFPKSGQKLAFTLDGTPAAGLTFAATATTAGGKATLSLTAGDPGNPRGPLDGQLYTVNVFLDKADPSNKRLEIKVRVFDKVAVPANPTFADARRILEPYARLYPFMKAFLDMADAQSIRDYVGRQADADKKKLNLDLPVADPRFMPVTRDLSKDKQQILLKWLANGMP